MLLSAAYQATNKVLSSDNTLIHFYPSGQCPQAMSFCPKSMKFSHSGSKVLSLGQFMPHTRCVLASLGDNIIAPPINTHMLHLQSEEDNNSRNSNPGRQCGGEGIIVLRPEGGVPLLKPDVREVRDNDAGPDIGQIVLGVVSKLKIENVKHSVTHRSELNSSIPERRRVDIAQPPLLGIILPREPNSNR